MLWKAIKVNCNYNSKAGVTVLLIRTQNFRTMNSVYICNCLFFMCTNIVFKKPVLFCFPKGMFHNSVRQLGTRLDVSGTTSSAELPWQNKLPHISEIRCSIKTFFSGSIEQHSAGVERGPESLVSRAAVRKVRRNKLKQLVLMTSIPTQFSLFYT